MSTAVFATLCENSLRMVLTNNIDAGVILEAFTDVILADTSSGFSAYAVTNAVAASMSISLKFTASP